MTETEAATAATTILGPLDDRVVIKPIKAADMTKGGVAIPETAREKSQKGEVVYVGPGKKTDSGRGEMSLKVGDIVIFSKYAGTEIKVNDEDVLIMRENDVLTTVSE